jgi:MFS family permease
MTVVDENNQQVDKGRTVEAAMPFWSPAQIIGLIVGIGFVVLGVAAVAKTGFDTDHIYRPVDVVWHMPHSPLFGVIEIGFGVLMVLASVVPGGSRTLMAFLGAISLAFGLVLLGESVPNRLNDWLGATHRNGWLFAIVGGVVLLAALLAPVFGGHVHRRETTTRQVTA